MEFRRYGIFSIRDFTSAWFAIAAFLTMSVLGILWDVPVYWCGVLLLAAVFMAGTILLPYLERFSLYEDQILVKRVGKTQTIPLPDKLTVLVTYAALGTAYANQSYILRGKYAITLLTETSIGVIVDRLHQGRCIRYTTSSVRNAFPEHQILYSFVGNKWLLEQMMIHSEYNLIVPESLQERVSLPANAINIFYDYGF